MRSSKSFPLPPNAARLYKGESPQWSRGLVHESLLVTSSPGEIGLLESLAAGRGTPRRLIRGSWPTVRPGSSQFAATELVADGSSRLVIADARSGEAVRVVLDSAPGAVIAPRVHHYSLWAPDGSRLAYVFRDGDQLALSVFDVISGEELPPVIRGAPIFTAWSADSRYLACHAGLWLQVLDAVSGAVHRTVTEEAAGFRVAASSVDGTLVYGAARDGALQLLATKFEGGTSREVGRFAGGVAMAFQPGTLELAVGVTHSPQTGTFEELWLLDVESGVRRLVSRGPFVAFYWSPAGDQLALVVPAQTGDARHYVRLVTPEGHQIAATEALVPSADARITLGFFDQYALSQPVWRNDGALLLAGRTVDDAVHATLGDPTGDYVFSWAAERGAPLQRLVPGQLAVSAQLLAAS